MLVPMYLFIASFALSASVAASPGEVQASASSLWFVCSWRNGGPAGATYYLSDVIAPGPGSEPTTLVPAFLNYVSTRYGLGNAAKSSGLADCIYKLSEADAKTLLTQLASRPPSGSKPVLTGWKYGMQASAAGAVAPSTNAPEPSDAARTPAAKPPSPPVSATVVVRLVDNVNSANAPPGKQYRAVVTQPVRAGSVTIPRDAMAKLTLEATADGFAVQLVAIAIDGQMTPVTSPPVTAARGAGGRVTLLPATQLTFSTMIPQPAPSAAATPAASTGRITAPATQTGGGKPAIAMCSVGGADLYVSAIFDAGKFDPTAYQYQHWETGEAAFENFIRSNLSSKLLPGSAHCLIFPSVARAQQTLDAWKQEEKNGAKLRIIETGWVYPGK